MRRTLIYSLLCIVTSSMVGCGDTASTTVLPAADPGGGGPPVGGGSAGPGRFGKKAVTTGTAGKNTNEQ